MHDRNDTVKVYFSSQFQRYSMWGEKKSEVAPPIMLDRKKIESRTENGPGKIVLKNMIIVIAFLQPVSVLHSSTTTQQTVQI